MLSTSFLSTNPRFRYMLGRGCPCEQHQVPREIPWHTFHRIPRGMRGVPCGGPEKGCWNPEPDVCDVSPRASSLCWFCPVSITAIITSLSTLRVLPVNSWAWRWALGPLTYSQRLVSVIELSMHGAETGPSKLRPESEGTWTKKSSEMWLRVGTKLWGSPKELTAFCSNGISCLKTTDSVHECECTWESFGWPWVYTCMWVWTRSWWGIWGPGGFYSTKHPAQRPQRPSRIFAHMHLYTQAWVVPELVMIHPG